MCKKNWHKARGGRRSKNYSPEASLLLFAANFPTLRGEEVYLSTSGWSEVRTILRRNVVPTLINGLIFIGILTQYYEKPNWLGK